jgi:hypothetical protein
MNVQRIELMGPEYVLMLGVWWGVAVVLTVAYLAAKRTILNRRQRQVATHDALPAATWTRSRLGRRG